MIPGATDPWAVFAEVKDDRRRAAQLGAAIGAILAEQHSRISASDVSEWLPATPSWPEPRDWISDRLPSVVDDADLIARAGYVMEAYESVSVEEIDRALVHTDVGFHNMAIDPKSFAVHGIFDYDGAAWADRHHDFRYLVFDIDRYEMLDAATSVYEAVVGRSIRRDRVLLYNAACAISYLAYRAGTEPEERSCGRTLAEDLRWSKHAIAKALAPPVRVGSKLHEGRPQGPDRGVNRGLRPLLAGCRCRARRLNVSAPRVRTFAGRIAEAIYRPEADLQLEKRPALT